MRTNKDLLKFVAALSCTVAPTLLMIIGIWMICSVGLVIGLLVGLIGYAASVWEYSYLRTYLKSKKIK